MNIDAYQTIKSDKLSISREDHILRLTLNCVKSRNSLSRGLISSLDEALSQAGDDASLKAIVLDHEGPVFSAGHDLKEMTAAREAEDGGLSFYTQVMSECSAMMQKIVNHPLPVIAQVNGTATAAGCQLVASCDLAFSSNHSKFATPGVNIGLFCSTPMVALSRNVSAKHAMEMLLTGEFVSAERAQQMGLINEAVEETHLVQRVDEVTKLLSSKARSTLKTGKQAFYRQREMTLQQAYDYAADVMVENMMRGDAREGISAFVEKRPPNWDKI